MPAPVNNEELLDLVRKSGVLDEKRLDAYLAKASAANAIPPEPSKFAGVMVRDGLLTHFQAEQFLQGKWRRFTIGRYKVLERLGAGGMGSVYLCEHKLMRRRVAVKVLPTAKADDPASLERFYREARAVAALDHPNIVRAYDIDQDDKLHFLVMEFVDGANFQEIIRRTGPMDVLRAAHYIRQSALGIQHAHETAGLVHRDIKPGNILVDRNGIVKILDMGLARFFHDQDDILTKKYDENVLGTADYLAPEQALDSHAVDIRADIYSLGATFYFILTGKPPFADGTVAQKLIWHQTRQPKPVRVTRPDVPEGLAAVLEKAMAKDPAARYQTPMEVAEALAPWTTTPIPPPPEAEMPQLSLAAMGADSGTKPPSSIDPPSGTRKQWQVANGAPSSAVTAPSSPAPALTAAAAPSPPTANLRSTGPMPVTAPAAPSPPPKPAAPVRRAAPLMQPVPKAAPRPALAPVPLRPAPAPARPAPAQAQVSTPAPAAPTVEEEEPASWDKLVSDTADPTAKMDTAPERGSKSGLAPRAVGALPALVSSRRLWIVVAAATAVVVLLIAIGVGIAIVFSSKPVNQANPPGRQPIRVDPSGAGNAFKTIQAAVDHASSGDHIVLAADIEEGEVNISHRQDLVIEADHPVKWKFSGSGNKLAAVDASPGFQMKGLELDGAGKADFLLTLFGGCPDLRLTDLKLHNFKVAGVNVISCDGAEGRPITLTGLHFTTTGAGQADFSFGFLDRTSIQKTQYFSVQNATHEGPGRKAVSQMPDAVKDVKLPDGWNIEAAPKPAP